MFVDKLYNILQSKILSNILIAQKEIELTIENIKNLRKDATVDRCINISAELNSSLLCDQIDKTNLRKLTYEILDSIIVQMEIRFGDFSNLQFVELLDDRFFATYNESFPRMKFQQLQQQYPLFKWDLLENELKNIYADPAKHLSSLNLLSFLVNNGLDSVYEEVTKLLRLFLTLPATTASSERSMSTLKRIKTHLRNSMTNERLSNLTTLAIEKRLLSEMAGDQSFISHAIDLFAEKKNRKIELVYKKI